MGSKWVNWILAAMVVSALGLSSCATTPSSPVESVTTASTKPYGTLTIAPNFYSAAFLNVTGKGIYGGSTYMTLLAAVFDGLVGQMPDGKLKPEIAERWEISSDGMAQTFYIRKGVKFHNGDELTGADVKFTLETVKANATSGDWRDAADRIELKDDYTVVIRLKQARFDLFSGLETGSGAGLPKRYIEEKGWEYFGLNPIGSGPWKVVKWEVGNRLELEAVEDHWRATPKFKNITFLNVKEEGTKVAMLKTGELDIAEIAPDSAAGLKAAGFRILGHYGGTQWMFAPVWDTDRPKDHPFGDVRVRKAMSLAVNRQEVGDKLAGGFGKPSSLTVVSKAADFYDHTVKPDPFDPEGAKKLLSEVGYPNGFDTKIWDSGGGSVLTNFTLALSGYWRKVGINANLEPVDWNVLIRKVNVPVRPPEVFGTVWSTPGGSSGRGDFSSDLGRFAMPAAIFRNPDPRLNELLKTVPIITDPTERIRLARETAVLAKEGHTRVAIVDIDILFALSSKVGELTLVPGNWGVAGFLDTIAHAK